MKRFKIKFEKRTENVAIGQHIHKLMTFMQTRIAVYLNRETANWTTAKMRTALILFCLLTGGGSVFIAARALIKAKGPPQLLHIDRIVAPKTVTPAPIITDSTKNKFHEQFKNNNNERQDNK